MHRDLKPENLIFLDSEDDSVLKIADFGLCVQIAGEDDLQYNRCGSPGYVAPEILRDEGYNYQCDIFSAGVIFYAILTGKTLFDGASFTTVLNNNKNCKFRISQKHWKNISPEAQDLVMKMLHQDWKKRITAQGALDHPWFKNSSNSENQAAENIHQIQRIRN